MGGGGGSVTRWAGLSVSAPFSVALVKHRPLFVLLVRCWLIQSAVSRHGSNGFVTRLIGADGDADVGQHDATSSTFLIVKVFIKAI